MKTVAIVQARMGSNRLPGKVLADLAGRPALGWVVRAARAVPAIDAVWVATSTNASDDPIAAWCEANQVPLCRGAEQDVLDRYAKAIAASGAEVVVRITADCPFFDPAVAGQAIRLRHVTGADYASNVDPQTWPDGLDCEVVTASALLAAAAEAKRPSDREHVTPFVRNNRTRFTWETLIAPLPGLRGERWTLDTAEDLQFLQEVARRIPADHVPSYLDILAIIDREPQLRKINQDGLRNAGYAAGVAADLRRTDRVFTRSQEFIDRAERAIPLGSQTFSKSRLQFPPGASPLFASHGDGGRVYDIDGNEYVDLVNALLPNVLGYRDLDVDTAIRRQLTRGISLSLPTTLETELAERLVKHVPCAEMVRFGKNGTDATSAAIRLARAATRRDRVIALGYHGWQDWYVGATTRNLGVPGAVSALTHMASYGDLAAVEKLLQAHPKEFAAVMLEPAGATEPAPGYLEGLKELVHRHGSLLVFDEIITGFRWALGGAQARYGFRARGPGSARRGRRDRRCDRRAAARAPQHERASRVDRRGPHGRGARSGTHVHEPLERPDGVRIGRGGARSRRDGDGGRGTHECRGTAWRHDRPGHDRAADGTRHAFRRGCRGCGHHGGGGRRLPSAAGVGPEAQTRRRAHDEIGRAHV